MVIIRVNRDDLKAENLEELKFEIYVQALRGVIVLPPWCELLSEEPTPEGIQIVQQKEDARVAELEKELAAAMQYITEQRSCMTCKQYVKALSECDNVCSECQKEDCFCRTCHNGSKWEWRGVCGNT